MAKDYRWLLESFHPEDIGVIAAAAQGLEAAGDLHTAATAWDRAWGQDPRNEEIKRKRQYILDRLSVAEHGIQFRYIPGGTCLMGSSNGDPDERPVHPVQLDHYWLAETPVSWD